MGFDWSQCHEKRRYLCMLSTRIHWCRLLHGHQEEELKIRVCGDEKYGVFFCGSFLQHFRFWLSHARKRIFLEKTSAFFLSFNFQSFDVFIYRFEFVLPAVVTLFLVQSLFILPSDSPARFSLGRDPQRCRTAGEDFEPFEWSVWILWCTQQRFCRCWTPGCYDPDDVPAQSNHPQWTDCQACTW